MIITCSVGWALAMVNGNLGEAGLRSLADKRHLNLGVAVQSDWVKSDLDGGCYRKAILDNFTMIEPENDLKPPAMWKSVGEIDFSKPDFLIDWAVKNHLKVRGHVLLYASDRGYTIPRWLLEKEKDLTADQARIILRDYIHAVVGRYRGKIAMWDVINEAIDDAPNTRPFNLRDSFWYRKLGVDFLLDAFQFAHEADPKCKLYYNDYSIENYSPKAENLLKLVDFLKEKKAPIDGIGLQFHRWAVEHPKPDDKFYQFLRAIQSRKLSFQMTELDLSVPIQRLPNSDPGHGVTPVNADDLRVQAEAYGAFLKMALSFKNCGGIQLWGVTDKQSWIPMSTGGSRGAALLFDSEYRPKPAYESVRQVLAGSS